MAPLIIKNNAMASSQKVSKGHNLFVLQGKRKQVKIY